MTGDEFRASVLERWELSDPEKVLLDQAASTLDLIAEVEASSMPLADRARELRASRLAFSRLLSQLALPDEDGEPTANIGHEKAKRAARARWGT